MKIVIYSVLFLAVVLIGYSATILDSENLLEGNSAGAVIAILASICVIVLMLILLVSRNISQQHQEL